MCMCDPNPSHFHMVILTSKVQCNSTLVLQLNPPHLPLCSRDGISYKNTTPPPRLCRSGFLTLCQPSCHFGVAAPHPNNSSPTEKLSILILQIENNNKRDQRTFISRLRYLCVRMCIYMYMPLTPAPYSTAPSGWAWTRRSKNTNYTLNECINKYFLIMIT